MSDEPIEFDGADIRTLRLDELDTAATKTAALDDPRG